jgi:hypothetical protein
MPASAAAVWSASERLAGRSAAFARAPVALTGPGPMSMTMTMTMTMTTTTTLSRAGMD